MKLGNSTLSVFALLVIGLVSFPATAQQKVAKDQLVGTWTLVSCTGANGGTLPYCINPNGRAVLEASGRYMLIIAARGRPKFTGAFNRATSSAEEYKAVAQGLVAQFGTWSFNEADQTQTDHAEAALSPNTEGTDLKYSVSLTGDELRYVAANGGVTVCRRAR
jgi:hypothetical protein